jgi:hypothetical protein
VLLHCSRTDGDGHREQRAAQAFIAPGAEARAAESNSRLELRAELERILSDWLARLVSGHLQSERGPDVQRSLVTVLDRAGWGQSSARESAAQIVVQQIFAQARLPPAEGPERPAQLHARAALARELARQLSLMAEGKSAGADAIAAEIPAGHLALSWARLGGFEYREGAPLPADVLALAGQRVALVGFMLSLGEAGDLPTFILVESLWGCCFGNVPQMNQMLLVQMRAAGPYTPLPVVVAGLLEVGEEREGDYVTSLYRLRDATLQPVDVP